MAPTFAGVQPQPVPSWLLQHKPAPPGALAAKGLQPRLPPRPFIPSARLASRPRIRGYGTGLRNAMAESGVIDDSFRTNSVTSTESDGPRIVVEVTTQPAQDLPSPEMSGDDASRFKLLHVSGLESAASTDYGSDYTSEGGESGHEVSLESVTPQLLASLRTQVEDYLSDEGLTKDLFLLKHVRRHREGFVSLKLLSGYKRVKKLSRDWRVLAMALKDSEGLILNDEGTKVRRVSPLPLDLQTQVPASRTLVAVRVAPEQATMEGLAKLFGVYGMVSSLQVVRPRVGGGVPSDLQLLANKVPEVASTICAIIEYDEVWGAARALNELQDPSMTLHVLRRSRSRKPSPTPDSPTHVRASCEFGVAPEDLRTRLKTTRPRRRRGDSSTSESEDHLRRPWRYPPSSLTPQTPLSPTARGSTSMPGSPGSFRRRFHNNHNHHNHSQSYGHSHNHNHNHHQSSVQQPVTRVPRGPDGTKGFRPRPSTTAQ